MSHLTHDPPNGSLPGQRGIQQFLCGASPQRGITPLTLATEAQPGRTMQL